MKLFLVLATTLLAVSALSERSQWINFKSKHSKIYKNVAEETRRYEIFTENLKKIETHNARFEAGLETYTMGVNQFADLTNEEFSAFLKRQGPRPQAKTTLHEIVKAAPEAIDWREQNAVLEVKNQGKCGSCWAFSSTGSLEGQNAIKNDQRISLSEQQLLDCSTSYGNGNCVQGGAMQYAFDYIKDNGINKETDYPYEGVMGSCRAKADSVIKVTGYTSVDNSNNALKNAIGTVGPVSVAIFAEPIQLYNSGVFNGSCDGDLDHGVLAVGYQDNYWIVKNSWGADWGEQGFFRLAENRCGITEDALYPNI